MKWEHGEERVSENASLASEIPQSSQENPSEKPISTSSHPRRRVASGKGRQSGRRTDRRGQRQAQNRAGGEDRSLGLLLREVIQELRVVRVPREIILPNKFVDHLFDITHVDRELPAGGHGHLGDEGLVR
jgi:hypothetical protein